VELREHAGVDAQLSLLLDPLSIFMVARRLRRLDADPPLLGRLHGGDRGYTRFFAYLNFFVFSMLLLVLAANFFLLIVGWAFVGAASYLLISLLVPPHDRDRGRHQGVRHQRGRRRRPRARDVLHLQRTRHARLPATFATSTRRSPQRGDLVGGLLLLLVGAFAKSAQVPLHTWLPDAMEGPTPVSALIHAATMVTAGVYLIARMHPLFEQAPAAADVGAIVGCVTLLIAATIGLVVTDLKRVIAYSTMSQIGYMIMAVSLGRLRARPVPPDDARLLQGAALHGGRLGDRGDGRRAEPRPHGRLPAAMPFTFGCMVIGGLALSRHPAVLGLLLQGRDPRARDRARRLAHRARRGRLHRRVLTAIYTFRMIFRAFLGEPCGARASSSTATSTTPRAHEPGDGRGGGHRRRLPGPEHHIAEREGP
jgi:NADH-quinone oxidoreductase subunit L